MNDIYNHNRFAPSETRAALVVAHPGHELMVHGWLEIVRPRVFVLTDGSGRSNQSRLDSTTRILNIAGATPGAVYGRLTDAAAYAAILNREFDLFIDLARELSDAFVDERIDFVAGDALEGYNPMHDVCRLVINAAVTVARRTHGRVIENFEFSLVSQPDAGWQPRANDLQLQLDKGALARKITVAQGYAELAGEVSNFLGATASTAVGVERLRPVDPDVEPQSDKQPFYEQYGEKQVLAGHYTRVLRYNEHMAPLVEALRSFAEGSVD